MEGDAFKTARTVRSHSCSAMRGPSFYRSPTRRDPSPDGPGENVRTSSGIVLCIEGSPRVVRERIGTTSVGRYRPAEDSVSNPNFVNLPLPRDRISCPPPTDPTSDSEQRKSYRRRREFTLGPIQEACVGATVRQDSDAGPDECEPISPQTLMNKSRKHNPRA